MKKKLLLVFILCAMLFAAVGCAGKSTDIALAFVFKNKTGMELKEAYVYPTGATAKGDNILKASWPTNTDSSQYLNVIIARAEADTYDITTVAADGTTTNYQKLALKFNNSVSMKEAGEISVKSDSEVYFSEDDLKKAGLTCSFATPKVDESKTTTLKFMFKNKTGKDAKEIYIYPSGMDTKMGDNVLTDVWANNTSDDMYKWTVIDRPDADVYDILVKFTDGTQLKYVRLDIKNSNSISMKDAEGALSMKYDDTIDADGKPVSTGGTISADTKEVMLRFIFKNKTGLTCNEAYVYADGATDKGANVLTKEWPDNTSDDMYLNMELDRAYSKTYTIEMKFADGTDSVFNGLDLFTNNNVSIKGSPIGAYLKFVEGSPVSSAVGGGSSSTAEQVTVAFVFKNKTGLTMKAAYLYPEGTEDKGVNFLSSDFENNTDKSMYRRIVMKVAKADYYMLYCEFADGSNATFKHQVMDGHNSVSVKGMDEISIKNDSEVSFTDDEIAKTLASGKCEEAK